MEKIIYSPLLKRIRNLFRGTLDSPWFQVIVENAHLRWVNLRSLRNFFNDFNNKITREDMAKKLEELAELIRYTQKNVLPNLKELLQISPLAPNYMVVDKNELLLRRCLAYTLPHNLGELLRLIEAVQETLKLNEIELKEAVGYQF